MIEGIPIDWRNVLESALSSPSFRDLEAFLRSERARVDTAIYPPGAYVFRALQLTPMESVRAVMVGQDPYHREGQAHGLVFSVPEGVTPPPSLANILDEWSSDLGQEARSTGSLETWARAGVLLLNTVLTVRRGAANSHRGEGWETFTDEIIRAVSARPDPVVFMLWGRNAQRKSSLINKHHIVVESNHPSPLSARRRPTPFLGSHPFTTANAKLAALGRPVLRWALTPGQ